RPCPTHELHGAAMRPIIESEALARHGNPALPRILKNPQITSQDQLAPRPDRRPVNIRDDRHWCRQYCVQHGLDSLIETLRVHPAPKVGASTQDRASARKKDRPRTRVHELPHAVRDGEALCRAQSIALLGPIEGNHPDLAFAVRPLLLGKADTDRGLTRAGIILVHTLNLTAHAHRPGGFWSITGELLLLQRGPLVEGMRVRAAAARLALLDRGDTLHLFLSQLETEHIRVAADALRLGATRDHHVAALDVPADDDLRDTHPVGVRDGLEGRAIQVLSLLQRGPGLGQDAALGVLCTQLILVETGVDLDLVHGRGIATSLDHLVQNLWVAIAYADAGGLPLIPQGHHVPVGGGEHADLLHWPVDQVQVHVVQAEALQGGIQSTGDTVVAIVPQLRGNEELLASHLAGIDGVLNGATDLFLVAVDRGGIDVAVARGDRGPHGVVAGLAGQLEGTEAQLRDLPTIVHDQQWNDGIIVQILGNSWHASLFTFFQPTPLWPQPDR